jgi:hypothetical protein
MVKIVGLTKLRFINPDKGCTFGRERLGSPVKPPLTFHGLVLSVVETAPSTRGQVWYKEMKEVKGALVKPL